MNDISEFKFDHFISEAYRLGASDIHFQTGSKPYFRVHGDVASVNFPEVSPADIEQVVQEVLNDRAMKVFDQKGAVDCSHVTAERRRVRVNVARCLEGTKVSCRLIPEEIPTIESFHMPDIFKDIATQKSGFIVMAGLTGNGKSTAIAAMIEHLNKLDRRNIITLEDPIEFVHTPRKSIFTRRELNVHFYSFADGIRTALRQDPDVLLVGEMRDPDTMRAAMQAAETGHLVFATLHCSGVETIPERIIGAFPEYEQSQIRNQVAAISHAFIAGQLLKRADETGRVAAFEILLLNTAARNMIRKQHSFNLEDVMQTERRHGMITMMESLFELHRQGQISAESLIAHAPNPERAEQYLKEGKY